MFHNYYTRFFFFSFYPRNKRARTMHIALCVFVLAFNARLRFHFRPIQPSQPILYLCLSLSLSHSANAEPIALMLHLMFCKIHRKWNEDEKKLSATFNLCVLQGIIIFFVIVYWFHFYVRLHCLSISLSLFLMNVVASTL